VDDIAVKVDHVSKTFKLPHERQSSLKSTLINFRKRGYEKQVALNDISFEVRKGEFFGIVGRNGSGKSTLLKMISGIYTPDSGSITVDGKLTPFIELGVGFNPELSGRENVFLNGALLGFSRKEMDAMYKDIVEFAELERFMDQKLKNYSSGMQVRLAFSIAVRANTDILILDEVLAVGDSAFQQKCFDYFAKLKRHEKTVILVTHSMAQVERFCNRAILIEDGVILEEGAVATVTSRYENLFIDEINKVSEAGKEDDERADNERFEVSASCLQDNKVVSAIQAREPFTLKIELLSKIDMKKLNLGVNIRDAFGNVVLSTDVRMLNEYEELEIKRGTAKDIELTIANYFTNGEYFVDLTMVDEAGDEHNKMLYNENSVTTFKIRGIKSHPHGMFHPDISLNIKDHE